MTRGMLTPISGQHPSRRAERTVPPAFRPRSARVLSAESAYSETASRAGSGLSIPPKSRRSVRRVNIPPEWNHHTNIGGVERDMWTTDAYPPGVLTRRTERLASRNPITNRMSRSS